MIALERIDAVPLLADNFSFQFKSWLSVLVDTLNSIMTQLEMAIVSTTVTTGITQLVSINSTYISSNAAQTTFTLPNQAMVGGIVTIVGLGAGGWILIPGSGQAIKVSSVNASASASITSANQYDTITIMCIVADTTWTTISDQTTGFAIA